MHNEFDQWNEVKKQTQNKELSARSYFCEREVWWCSIGVNIGVEANGKNEVFERPVLLVRVFNKDMAWVVPVTSTMKNSPYFYPFHFNNQPRSLVLTQMRTISTKRLRRMVDIISEEMFAEVQEKLIDLLQAKRPPKEANLSTSGKPDPEAIISKV